MASGHQMSALNAPKASPRAHRSTATVCCSTGEHTADSLHGCYSRQQEAVLKSSACSGMQLGSMAPKFTTFVGIQALRIKWLLPDAVDAIACPKLHGQMGP